MQEPRATSRGHGAPARLQGTSQGEGERALLYVTLFSLPGQLVRPPSPLLAAEAAVAVAGSLLGPGKNR